MATYNVDYVDINIDTCIGNKQATEWKKKKTSK